ncbi:hypothetical protein [Caballeronia sp. SBC2]|uniref:hypothetical protein n=1 Tax=Caballeronia sp. SBC2 TaxID=2705547 RepID=UPI0019D117B7|nr:hypothetical protein [Caballeronia sp. SBC2]
MMMAPATDVPCAGVVAAEVDVPAAPPEDVEAEAGLLELAEPDEAPAGALAEAGLLAEPETPLG